MSVTLRDQVAAYFKAHPGEWLSMQELARIGGTGGWRSRVSDLRVQVGMEIENRQFRKKLGDGREIAVSEYRWIPPADDFELTA